MKLIVGQNEYALKKADVIINKGKVDLELCTVTLENCTFTPEEMEAAIADLIPNGFSIEDDKNDIDTYTGFVFRTVKKSYNNDTELFMIFDRELTD